MSYAEALLDEWLAGQPCASPACDGSTDDGQPCPQCGTIPAVTRPELQAELEKDPLAADDIFAQRAIAKGAEMLDAAISQIHEADRIRHMAVLRLARDVAQASLNEHAKAHRELAAGHQPSIRKAERAELKARRELQVAQDECGKITNQLTEAQRYKRVAEEIELTGTLRDAERIRDRYKKDHADAAAGLARAVAPVKASEKAGKQLELSRDEAVGDLDNPGRIGYGAEAITLGLMRLVERGELSGDEQLLAGQLALDAVSRSGVLEMLKAQVRAEVLAEADQAAKAQPLIRRADGVVVGNPFNPATPQPFHPAQGQPHPVQAATTPGWG